MIYLFKEKNFNNKENYEKLKPIIDNYKKMFNNIFIYSPEEDKIFIVSANDEDKIMKILEHEIVHKVINDLGEKSVSLDLLENRTILGFIMCD